MVSTAFDNHKHELTSKRRSKGTLFSKDMNIVGENKQVFVNDHLTSYNKMLLAQAFNERKTSFLAAAVQTNPAEGLRINFAVKNMAEGTEVSVASVLGNQISKHNNMLFGAYYRPPQFSISSFLTDLDIELRRSDNTTTVIAGDCSINIDDSTPASVMYKILSNCNCFSTLNTLPTRVTENTKSVVDPFLSNSTNEDISICTINTAFNDHRAILLEIACKVSSLKHLTNEVTTKIDYVKLRTSGSPNETVKTIVNGLSEIIIESSSIKPANRYTKYSMTPWATPHFLNLVKERDKLFKKF
ncbi:hypothetical protein PR048_010500 [Dryococelus australis]|uniref:Uncharacterized protein n=1 Tax=Dryococelus australis TaxID=614101 RepID=A0ABQ9I3R7_9NEOP|nr:hypothetical protein PR048_010500 [Dryococelus australis]